MNIFLNKSSIVWWSRFTVSRMQRLEIMQIELYIGNEIRFVYSSGMAVD